MKHDRLLPLMIGLMLAVLLASACSAPAATSTPIPPTAASPPPTPTPVLAAVPKSGDWKGSGDHGFSISFTIGEEGSAITGGFGISWDASCGGKSIQLVQASTGKVRIEAGEITYEISPLKLSGKVVAPNQIEGTFRIAAQDYPQLGQCQAVEGAWAASLK